LIPGLNDRPAKSSGAVKRARNVHRDAARTCDTASGKIAHPKQKVGLIVKAAGRRNEPFSRSWNDFARLWSLSGLRLTPPGVGHGHWSNHRNDPFSLEKPGRCLERVSVSVVKTWDEQSCWARVPCGGDIIRTVVVHPTLDNLIVLAIIVVIRTFLSITLQLEAEGHWPWQHHDISGTKVARIKEQEGRGSL
jgi:hypothetical protein